MKTLEENILGLELCSGTIDYCNECPYKTSEYIKDYQTCDEYEVPLMMLDAVYYLKKYKELLKTWNEKKEKEDKPLTWNEIRQMEGKAIWIKNLISESSEWYIIRYVYEDRTISLTNRWGEDITLSEWRMNDSWQGYRMEKHEDAR